MQVGGGEPSNLPVMERFVVPVTLVAAGLVWVVLLISLTIRML